MAISTLHLFLLGGGILGVCITLISSVPTSTRHHQEERREAPPPPPYIHDESAEEMSTEMKELVSNTIPVKI